MKIAVCQEHGEVFQHFGHTPEFLVCEVADGRVVSSEVLPSGGIGHGALAGLLREDFRCSHHDHGEGHSCGDRHEEGGHRCGGHCHG